MAGEIRRVSRSPLLKEFSSKLGNHHDCFFTGNYSLQLIWSHIQSEMEISCVALSPSVCLGIIIIPCSGGRSNSHCHPQHPEHVGAADA